MSIQGIKAYQDIASIKPLENKSEVKPQGIGAKETGFAQYLGEALKDVNNLQLEADRQIEGLVTGKPGVTAHEAMIALEKADIAFQLMGTVKSKIIRAYEELLRTQV